VPELSTIAAFALASVALLVIPGPAVLFIIDRSVADGRTVGLASVAGIEIGSLVHVVAAGLGVSAALAASAVAFNTIKWLGVIYLVVIGLRTLTVRPARADDTDAPPAVPPARAFRQGVVVNILNPKVALFFLSFLPQFVDPARGTAGVQAVVLGLVFVSIGTVTDGLYAVTASSLRTVLLRGRALPFVQRYVAGTVFIGLGLVAATSGGHAKHTA
jgi:threonine/homoserine/homoserine lactone efflux protein